jgi:hypothetical protein
VRVVIAVGVALVSMMSAVAPPADAGAPVGCPSQPASEQTHATVPPDLQLLEQAKPPRPKTIRVSGHAVLVTPKGTLSVRDVAEGRSSPKELKNTETLTLTDRTGKTKRATIRELDIGDTAYTYKPSVARDDGGRPWVRGRVEGSQHGPQGSKPFGPTLAQLERAQSIVETAPTTVGNRQARQFAVSFAAGELPRESLPLAEAFEQDCSKPVQLDLAVSPSGLPLLLRVSADYLDSGQPVSVTSTTEILAIDFRFAPLVPPPAKKTISAAALRKLESERVRKELGRPRAHRVPRTVRHPT